MNLPIQSSRHTKQARCNRLVPPPSHSGKGSVLRGQVERDRWQGRRGQARAGGVDGAGEQVGGVGLAQAAGVDDAGQQGDAVRAYFRAGAVADASGDHVVAQLAFGGIVGERQPGVVQRLHDDLPVIEKLARKFAQRLLRRVAVLFA